MRKSKIIFLFVLFSLLSSPLSSSAISIAFYETNPDFNPNLILSDSSLGDYNSMTVGQIRDFAAAKGGTLDTYIDPVVRLPAYWIIWQTAQEFRISPKFILTMLQKEQSLVTDDSPDQKQYDWAVGYSCYGGICLDRYKGFAQQIRSMANKIMNSYLADLNVKSLHKKNFFCTFTKWCIGDARETQDYQLIIPQNKITAALYTYNPYRGGTVVDGYKIGANYNFWKIWNSWFDQKVFRPGGSLLKTADSDKVYLIQNGKKRPFATFSSLVTRYDPENIIIVEPGELDQYEIGGEIRFAQYSLLANSQGDIYLLVDDSLRHIVSAEVFRTLGFNPEEVETVDNTDLVGLAIGREITINSAYPTGALIKDAKTGGVYYVLSGFKYPIFSKEILKANFLNQSVLSASSDELEKYPKGEAVKFKEASLIKSTGSDVVYVISDGRKLPIADEKAFVSRGYQWDKIISTSQAAVDIHPTGETLEFLDTSLVPKTPDQQTDVVENLIEEEDFLEAENATSTEDLLGELESLLDNPNSN